MKQKLISLFLLLALFAALLPTSVLAAAEEDVLPVPPQTDSSEEAFAAAAALAELIQPDGGYSGSGTVRKKTADPAGSEATDPEAAGSEAIAAGTANPEASSPEASDSEAVSPFTVTAGEVFYAYEGMTVFNNGGTVYSSRATVYCNGGTVFSTDGTVYANAGTAYCSGGAVYCNGGTVYSDGAEVFTLSSDRADGGQVLRSFELKFAGYYSPFIVLDGAVAEPGSERMLIGEDAVCRIGPWPGYLVTGAKASAGTLARVEEDGSFLLTDVDADVTLTLTLRAEPPAISPAGGVCSAPQTVTLSGPTGSDLYYTLDGSIPDADTGTRYDGPFEVGTSCTVTAVACAAGVEASLPAVCTFLFPMLEAPDFADRTEGYDRPCAGAITVQNPGSIPFAVTGVTLEGEHPEAFVLGYTAGRSIPAGAVDSGTWSVRPVEGLSAGLYEAAAVFTLSDSGSVTVPLRFQVNPAFAE